MIKNKVITVFTFRSTEHIIEMGGSEAWTCDQQSAASCEFIVVSRNAKGASATDDRDHLPAEGDEPHGSAFMIGRVSDVVLSEHQPSDPKKPARYMIKMSEWAAINIPNVWKGWRRPFKYMTIEDLGIDPSKLDWQPMELPVRADPISASSATAAGPTGYAVKGDVDATNMPVVADLKVASNRSLAEIVAELKGMVAQQNGTTPDKVKVGIEVQTTKALSF